MSIQAIIVVSSALVNLVLGVSIFLRNTKSKANRAFLLLTLSIVFWMTASYLTDNAWNFDAKLLFGKVTFAAALIIGVAVLNLSKTFPLKSSYKLLERVSLSIVAIVFALSLTNQVVGGITLLPSGVTSIVPGKLYFTWVVAFIFVGFVAVLAFFKQYRKVNLVGKNQLRLMILGISTGLVLGLSTNVIIPSISPSLNATNFGPFATVVFILATGYAIVRHRLFDIRLVIARTLAYVLSVGVMVAIYLFVVLGLGQYISIGPKLSFSQRTFYVLVALVFSVTLPYLKKLFDKLTNKIFFRDAYDSQFVLNQIGKVIVGNVSTHKIQRGSLEVFEASLRPSFMAFLMLNSSDKLHVPTSSNQTWSTIDEQQLSKVLKKRGAQVTIFDELEEHDKQLKEALAKEDISVVAPFQTRDSIIGYLVAGPKKSGDIYNGQDIRLLGIAANELAVALQNAQRFEEIQAFNLTLQEKVNDATKELKGTNKKLVELDEAKDEFISMASHQLRTPLTSIKGYISMMIEGDLGKLNVQQKTALKEAFTSSQRMVFLIADFLNVSRIKTGKFVIEAKPLDLPEMVQEELTQLKEMAESKHLELIYEPPHAIPTVMLDDNKMHQVMMNLVDNAIYYTPAGGTITIQLYATEGNVVFKVIDTGIGVPKAEQHKLFTKFYRAGNARKARPDGTGLGLYMAQKIVVEQEGTMIFESVEGKGSTFGFQFPLSKIKV